MKDNEIRDLINTLRDIAREFHAHDSLRDRIADVLGKALHKEAIEARGYRSAVESMDPGALADRLRRTVAKLRTTSMPLADLIPLMQQTADKLDWFEEVDRANEVLTDRLSALLTGTTDALKGKAPPGVRYSWHDLPVMGEAAVRIVTRLLEASGEPDWEKRRETARRMIAAEAAGIEKERAA